MRKMKSWQTYINRRPHIYSGGRRGNLKGSRCVFSSFMLLTLGVAIMAFCSVRWYDVIIKAAIAEICFFDSKTYSRGRTETCFKWRKLKVSSGEPLEEELSGLSLMNNVPKKRTYLDTLTDVPQV